MNYKEAINYIQSTEKFGIKPGLERISRLLELLGNPQDKVKIVHIAGTNGKGSVCSMVSNVLITAGFKVGMTVSPYVVQFNERIAINNEPVCNEALAEIVTELIPYIAQVEREGFSHPTEFEIITACAYYYFARQKCDFAVIETGLGGRFDATNAVKNPELTAITSISLDHTAILGDTLTKIAFEKAGIIKHGIPVIIYPKMTAEARLEIERIAKIRKCEAICPSAIEVSDIKVILMGTSFIYKEKRYNLSLLGEHQAYNAVMAIELVSRLSHKYPAITQRAISAGLNNAIMPARMEIISKNPYILLDGAHNPEGIDALNKIISHLHNNKKITVVMGMMKDKNYEYCIGELAKTAESFIAVKPDMDRALSIEEVIKAASKYCKNVSFADSPIKGAEKAIRENKDNFIVVCGSFYMAGEIRNRFYKGRS
jgi:dihydrofolate synthase/folylpolyglutamate synthase